MSGKSINFEDKEINNDLDVNKILVSKKESYGTKN